MAANFSEDDYDSVLADFPRIEENGFGGAEHDDDDVPVLEKCEQKSVKDLSRLGPDDEKDDYVALIDEHDVCRAGGSDVEDRLPNANGTAAPAADEERLLAGEGSDAAPISPEQEAKLLAEDGERMQSLSPAIGGRQEAEEGDKVVDEKVDGEEKERPNLSHGAAAMTSQDEENKISKNTTVPPPTTDERNEDGNGNESDSSDDLMILKEVAVAERQKTAAATMLRRTEAVERPPSLAKNAVDVEHDALVESLTETILRQQSLYDLGKKVTDEVDRFIFTHVVRCRGDVHLQEKFDHEFRRPLVVFEPPSQVVKLMGEKEADESVRSLLVRQGGKVQPSGGWLETAAERAEWSKMRSSQPAPAFTYVLFQLGLNQVAEVTYKDIVNFKNLPEKPRNIEQYEAVCARLRPMLAELEQKNESFREVMTNRLECSRCDFRTHSKLVLERHQQYPHKKGDCVSCGYCRFDTTYRPAMDEHYLTEHGFEALYDESLLRFPCPICEKEFHMKGLLQNHLKICKRSNYYRQKYLNLKPSSEDLDVVNQTFWAQPSKCLLPMPLAPGCTMYSLCARFSSGMMMAASNQNLIFGGRLAPNQGVRRAEPVGAKQQQPTRRSVGPVRRMANILPKPPALMETVQTLGHQRQQNVAATVEAVVAGQGRAVPPRASLQCEICDALVAVDTLLVHLQRAHKQLLTKNETDMTSGPPLACSRCRERFWTYEGLERHLVMIHCLVTSDLLAKAQQKQDSGRCRICTKAYAFNLLQHLVQDHRLKLCSAEIVYSCDVCAFSCSSYKVLEKHLAEKHPNAAAAATAPIHGGSLKRPLNGTRVAGPSTAKKAVPPSRSTLASYVDSRTTKAAATPATAAKKSRVKYTCTPCANRCAKLAGGNGANRFKFESYADVIRHWQEKHLKAVSVPLCRVDCCPKHRDELEAKYNVGWDFPDETVITLE